MTTLPEINLPMSISVVGMLTATFAAVIAGRSYRLAKGSYSLAARAAGLSEPNITLYLIDSFRLRPRGSDKLLFVYCVSIENKSTIQNTIVSIELRLPLLREGLERLAIFTHSSQFARPEGLAINNPFALPAGISARGALIANCCFEIPTDLLQNSEFDRHILRFKVTEGPFAELQPKLIMDVADVQDLEEKRIKGIPI